METPYPIGTFSAEQMTDWLSQALTGLVFLPRLSPDESHSSALIRLERALSPSARDTLRVASKRLLLSFCQTGKGERAYVEELLAIVGSFNDPECIKALADLAKGFARLPRLEIEIRRAILATLADGSPPQNPAFWEERANEDPESFLMLALSGILATDPQRAIGLLNRIPNSETLGNAAVLKLDVAWDALEMRERFALVRLVREIATQCNATIRSKLLAWACSKQSTQLQPTSASLFIALKRSLGADAVEARTLTPKLCPRLAA